jgi:hypothetical protein
MMVSLEAEASGVDPVETNPESIGCFRDAKRLVEAIQGASLDKVGAVWALMHQEARPAEASSDLPRIANTSGAGGAV